MTTVSSAILITALRNYGGHLAECSTQKDDDSCNCGWIHVHDMLFGIGESGPEAELREAALAAANAIGQPFWNIEVLVHS